MVVGDDHSLAGVAQNGAYDLGAPACGNGELDSQMRDKDPEITTQAFAFPAGLVDIEDCGIGKGLPDLFRRGLQLRAEAVHAVADGSNAKVQPEKRAQDLRNTPSADLVHGGEVADGAVNSWTELTGSHLGGNFGPGVVSTSALELVASVLGRDRLDFRQLKGLIPQRFGGLLAARGVQRG